MAWTSEQDQEIGTSLRLLRAASDELLVKALVPMVTASPLKTGLAEGH